MVKPAKDNSFKAKNSTGFVVAIIYRINPNGEI